MLSSNIPLRFTLAWAKNAGAPYIRTVPVASQIGVVNGAASFNDGFVPNNFAPLAGGGVPPFGQDINGVLNVTTAWDQWYQAGGAIPFDSTFSTAVGGYPKDSRVASAITPGVIWYSTADNNLTNPDDPLTSAGWARLGLPAGTPIPLFTTTAPAGFVNMNALTIGSAASGAGFADASALFLYVHNWLNFSNALCPILTSGGSATTRGANAVADFNANKQLTLPNGKGLGFIGADTMGGSASTLLSGVPVATGNTTTPGSTLGENLHQLTQAELAFHAHNGSGTTGFMNASNPHSHGVNGGVFGGSTTIGRPQTTVSDGFVPLGATGIGINNTDINHGHFYSFTTDTGGTGNGTHNTVHRSMIVFWGQKL